MYLFASKLIVPIIFLVLIYARFLNVESTQREILEELKRIEEKHDTDRGTMYRFVADKEEDVTSRLDRKTKRIEDDLKEVKNKLEKHVIEFFKDR